MTPFLWSFEEREKFIGFYERVSGARMRLYLDHFSRQRHFGFEAAAWYWHSVDVVGYFMVRLPSIILF